MPPAAKLTSVTGHGTPLAPGPGCPTVMIGGMPAWRALPSAMASAVEGLSNAMNSFMVRPQLTPVDATASLVKISASLIQGGAAAAASGAPAAAGVASASSGALTAANIALTAVWTAAVAVPGAQPAANIAYTEGIKAAAAIAASAVMASMAGLSDMHLCPIPVPLPPHGPGFVTMGSTTVVIGNLSAARQGDQVFEACGGPDPIAMGCPTVIIGDSGGGASGGGGLAAILLGLALAGLDLIKGLLGLKYPRQAIDKNGKVVTLYNQYITIEGSPEYQAAVVSDLNRMAATKTGKLTLDEFAKTGKHITIKPVKPGGAFDNGACDYADPADNAAGRGQPDATGKPGKGADGVIEYNPSLTNEYTGTDGKTYTQEPFEVLNHEMIHGVHQAQGNDLVAQTKPSPYDNKEEMQTIGANDGIDDYSKGDMTEAALSKEQGDSPRPDHDSVTKSTYKDGSGNWHESTTDAAGNTTDKVIPGPPGGGTPSK